MNYRLAPLVFAGLALCLQLAVVPPRSIGAVQSEPPSELVPAIARGVVFEDINVDGRLDDHDRRLSGVRVSNGVAITTTNEQGQYEIPVGDDTIVFVIKPAGFRTRLDANHLPLFYYIHKPAGSPRLQFPGVPPTGPLPASIDFPLVRQSEPDRFQAILFGDTQSRNATEVGYMNRTTIPELIGSDAAFGVTLGDIMFDDLNQFDYHNQSVALIGIPWYNVLGNHDLNFDAAERPFCNETFEQQYGPTWYSYDYGQVHFVVLDNINWFIPEGETSGKYTGLFGTEQLEFLKNDLQLIPDDQFVVLFMHIPLPDCEDAPAIYRLIEGRPLSFSVSAHRHFHQHRFLNASDGWRGERPHHHLVNVTVCGNWWSGRKTADGIPHSTMTDGAPYGYTIVTFDGDDYQLDYKASGLPADHQMRITVPDEIPASATGPTPVSVNVFNGSERSTVRMRLDGAGPWQPLTQTTAIDPWYQALYDAELSVTPPIEPAMSKPRETSHLWIGTLPALNAGVHLLEVQTTDMDGRNFESQRLIHVLPDPAAGPGSR